MTTGEQLSSWSSVSSVSAMEHLMNLSIGGEIVFIPASSFDANIDIVEYSSDITLEDLDTDIVISDLDADVMIDEYSTDIEEINLEGDISCA